MRFHDFEADRLNHFLDARVQGRQVDPDDLDPTLVDAYEQVRAMDARPAPDPQLMTNIWRSMMSTVPLAIDQRPQVAVQTFPSQPSWPERRNWSVSRALAAAFALLALLLAGTIGYQRYGHDSEPGQPTTIPAAIQEFGTPTATGCEALPREPGSIAAIVESPQTLHPYLPRFGYDPVYGESQDGQAADGQFLLNNSTADDSAAPEIKAAIEELVECRFYAVDGTGQIDMDGRYFALYSDDFIRRELSGYREAGRPLVLTAWWAPHTAPTVGEIRRLTGLDGQVADKRVLAALDMPNNEPKGTLVVIFRQQGDRWLVDEVGFATMPTGPATPVPATPEPGSWTDQFPLQLDIAIHDEVGSGTPVGMSEGRDPTECGPFDLGTPVPCGAYYQQNGPYFTNQFPANTDFTITLYNLGEQPKRLEIADLGVVVELKPGGSETIILNADAGDYLFTIYQGDQPDPISAGVFTFIPPDGPPPARG